MKFIDKLYNGLIVEEKFEDYNNHIEIDLFLILHIQLISEFKLGLIVLADNAINNERNRTIRKYTYC